MAHTFSTYQLAIFNHIAESNNNLAINAVAGSGKTTTIVEAAKRIPKNKEVLFLAFNKTIANELKERLYKYPNVTCCTLHAHGLSALRDLRPQVDKYFEYNFKNTCLMNSEVLSIDSENQYIIPFKNNCAKLYNLARINLIKNDIYKLQDLCDNHQIECIADEVNVIFDLRADCPLAKSEYHFDKRFLKAVKRVGKYLLLNDETAEYYKEVSDIQKEYMDLIKKF